jgi:photosystem II stability/assembly factor-like uncharacterized protein
MNNQPLPATKAAIRRLPELAKLASITVLSGLCLYGPLVNAQGDALQESAIISPIAQHSLIMDIDRVGDQLIAIGERGHILRSDDQAKSWQQVEAPVRVTLTSTFFVDDRHGWAVGHDGVVLRSRDGGNSWVKVLDGYQANQIVLDRAAELLVTLEAQQHDIPAEQQADFEVALENATILFEDAEAFTDEGASRPLLDLWFKNEREGIVIGAYGLILRTTDGGDSWHAWFDHLDNPDGLHLNAIRQVGDTLYLTAEAGNLYRSSDWGQSWELLDSPYYGSFFGLAGNDHGHIIAYGLRGNAYRSNDGGDSWQRIDTGVDASLFGSTQLDDGTTVLVGNAGVILFIDDQGQLVGKQQTSNRLPLSSVMPGNANSLIITGLAGVQNTPIKSNRILEGN